MTENYGVVRLSYLYFWMKNEIAGSNINQLTPVPHSQVGEEIDLYHI